MGNMPLARFAHNSAVAVLVGPNLVGIPLTVGAVAVEDQGYTVHSINNPELEGATILPVLGYSGWTNADHDALCSE